MLSNSARGRRVAAFALALAGASVLASCGTPTPYQPATASTGGYLRNGYLDEQIETNRFRVSFSGNSLTSRETVERYLLYRSAQLTLERGFDHFVLADRDTEKKTRTYVTPGIGGYGYGPYYGWAPYWRYHGAWGWRSWDPFWGDPFWGNDVDVHTVDNYTAQAEIVLGKGPKPNDVKAFDARNVVETLGPKIIVPQPKS